MFKNFAFVALCVVVACVGCKKSARPDGMPNLVPAKITVTQNGAPLADAALNLVSADGSSAWPVGGKTDAKGVAVLYTRGEFKGAPEGAYKVAVVKNDVEIKEGATDEEGNPYKPTPEQLANPLLIDARYATLISLVPEEYANAQTSPLEVSISAASADLSVDVPALE
ncbi:MAG: hypothetical protein HUK22_04365 [Thermoguttaceae bacterium]|nr:hypothetical protein [Thermoguttaceae bacterium]